MKSSLIRVSDDLELFVEESGTGCTAVVFVPGWTMSTQVFEHQRAFFESSTDYRFITFDPRAHGKSTQSPSGHTYEQHARDLSALVDALALDNIILVGWSFGTLTALGYVNQFGSDRVSGMVMLDGPAKAVGHDEAADWFTYHADDRDGAIEFFTMGRLRDRETALHQFAEWLLEEGTREDHLWIIQIAQRTPDSVAALLNASSIYCDFQDELISLAKSVPLLYVLRESRGSAIEKWAKRYTPGATVTAFGGHMMFWERPEEFNVVLLDYLKKCQ